MNMASVNEVHINTVCCKHNIQFLHKVVWFLISYNNFMYYICSINECISVRVFHKSSHYLSSSVSQGIKTLLGSFFLVSLKPHGSKFQGECREEGPLGIYKILLV